MKNAPTSRVYPPFIAQRKQGAVAEMMNVRPLFFALVVFILALMLVACNSDSGTDNNAPNNDDDLISGQPDDASSGGTLELGLLRVSQNECTSPCSVIFSVDAVTDSSAINPFTDTGIYWDYDDDQADEREGTFTRGAQYFLAGRQPNTGASREFDTNTPISMHTYHCEQGTCAYYPGVSLQNAAGDWVTAWATITVHASTDTFSEANTVCYSTSGDFQGCPDNANRVTSNTLPRHYEWASNTHYLLRRGDVFSSAEPPRICIAYDRENILISSFGPGTQKAEISSEFGIGVDNSCHDLLVDNTQAQNMTTPFWVRNITLTDLRLHALRLGMTFSDITLHNLDMDYEDSLTGGGYVIMENSNYCSNNAALSCSNVPLPKGLYFSDIDMTGSRHIIPGNNIGLLPTSCVSFLGFVDVAIEVAFEHNIRVECSSRTVVSHSDINGNHIGTNGNKHGITLRPEGYYDADMLIEGIRRSSNAADGGTSNVYENRYSAIKDVYLGTPESVNNASRISIAPSNATLAEVTRFSLVSASVSNMSGGSGSGSPNREVNFAGSGLTCYDDNLWETTNGCGDGHEGAIPPGGFEPLRTISPPIVPLPPGQIQ